MLEEVLNKIGRTKEILNSTSKDSVSAIVMDWMNKRIEVAKEILQQTHSATGSLAKPTLDIKLGDDKVIANLLTEYYWDFINSGVAGVGGVNKTTGEIFGTVKTVPNLEGVMQKFKTPFGNRNMAQALMGQGKDVTGGGAWIDSKGLGAQNRESLAYAIATNVKKRGIEANEYINIAFSPESIQSLEDLIFEEIEKIWQ
jgi:hypothetical protein